MAAHLTCCFGQRPLGADANLPPIPDAFVRFKGGWELLPSEFSYACWFAGGTNIGFGPMSQLGRGVYQLGKPKPAPAAPTREGAKLVYVFFEREVQKGAPLPNWSSPVEYLAGTCVALDDKDAVMLVHPVTLEFQERKEVMTFSFNKANVAREGVAKCPIEEHLPGLEEGLSPGFQAYGEWFNGRGGMIPGSLKRINSYLVMINGFLALPTGFFYRGAWRRMDVTDAWLEARLGWACDYMRTVTLGKVDMTPESLHRVAGEMGGTERPAGYDAAAQVVCAALFEFFQRYHYAYDTLRAPDDDKSVPVESFSQFYWIGHGDCEDRSLFCMMLFQRFMAAEFEEGSLAAAAQRIMRPYSMVNVHGRARPSVAGFMGRTASTEGKPFHIVHMYGALVPYALLDAMDNGGEGDAWGEDDREVEYSHAAWHDELGPLLVEGTTGMSFNPRVALPLGAMRDKVQAAWASVHSDPDHPMGPCFVRWGRNLPHAEGSSPPESFGPALQMFVPDLLLRRGHTRFHLTDKERSTLGTTRAMDGWFLNDTAESCGTYFLHTQKEGDGAEALEAERRVREFNFPPLVLGACSLNPAFAACADCKKGTHFARGGAAGYYYQVAPAKLLGRHYSGYLCKRGHHGPVCFCARTFKKKN